MIATLIAPSSRRRRPRPSSNGNSPAQPHVIDLEPGDHFVLEDVSWELYEHLLRDLDRNRRHVRVTYDDGRLELMTLTNLHEQAKTLVGRLVELYAVTIRIPIVGAGSVTLKKKDKRKGLEPDECYYVQTPAPAMRVRLLNLKKYPPPDLAIEIDVSRSSVPREPIYAAIGVPEVWRFDGQHVVVLHRLASGKYRASSKSTAFPKLPITELNRFLAMALETSQDQAVFAFWDWLEKQRGK